MKNIYKEINQIISFLKKKYIQKKIRIKIYFQDHANKISNKQKVCLD